MLPPPSSPANPTTSIDPGDSAGRSASGPSAGLFADEAEAALSYLNSGLQPIPLDGPKTKTISRKGWPAERYTAADAAQFRGRNIGLLLGEPSGGPADVDQDCPEAVRAAPYLLPRTDMVHGRPGAPSSHWWYSPVGEAKSLKLTDPTRAADHSDGNVLVELRVGPSKVTMVPPSVHPCGELLAWSRFGRPAEVTAAELVMAVKSLAAATLLGRHLPRGQRHDAALALAGGLLRSWSGDFERVKRFVRAVCAAADDEEVDDRLRAVDDTAAKPVGSPASGWPTLAKIVGDKIVTKVREWLGLTTDSGGVPAATAASPPIPPAAPWPDPPAADAFGGLAGDVVRAIDPTTEADPAAVLFQFLVAFGSRIGRGPTSR